MRKNRKNLFKASMLTAALLAVTVSGTCLLNGCGSGSSGDFGSSSSSSSSSSSDYYGESDYYTSDEAAYYSDTDTAYYSDGVNAGYSESAAAEISLTSSDMKAAANDTSDTDADNTSQQKLIVTWSLNMETQKYDEALASIKTSVAAAGGYIESENESCYNENSRYESLTIRIPADQAQAWIDGVSAYGTITSRSKNTEDVTLTYVDMESRLNALRTEQQTLLKMMEKAETITDMITIQTELTNVNADIESYESQLRVMDNQVDYTTIYMDIDEVHRESVVEQNFFEEVKETFLNSTDTLFAVVRNLAVGILGNSVIIIIVAVIIAVPCMFIKKHVKRIKAKRNKDKSADYINRNATDINASDIMTSDNNAADHPTEK